VDGGVSADASNMVSPLPEVTPLGWKVGAGAATSDFRGFPRHKVAKPVSGSRTRKMSPPTGY